ncbi:MAG: M23 family metallopeptidase [Firmicutes bacterium]|nr:M23 family metallopeptidase [Bacillota bacterium]
MTRKSLIIQAAVCLLIFAVVQSGIHTKEGKLGDFLSRIAEVVNENYTLAELLELGESAEEAMVMAPGLIGDTLMSASELGTYGTPMDEDSDDVIKNVYASAGGKVVKSGVSSSLGLYVMIEHPGKISTYGNLSNIRVVTGERVTKGDILGTYDSTQDADFYYALEDKSGNSA